ncbi:MAG TPA: sulfatase [Myxococcota bacterium]|nr:sulfatase [Myxococcota bacterium]
MDESCTECAAPVSGRRLARRRWLLAGLAALLVVALPLWVRLAAAPPPLVLLVVFDALRADHLSQYGYALPTSPGLAKLAARATLFRNVYAPASYTTASTASLLTGLSPLRHGARKQGARLAGDVVTLAELMRARGYRARGVSFNPVVADVTGFTQGFEEFAEREKGSPFNLYPDIGDGLRVIRRWVDDAREPLFVYFQPMNTHGPYIVPPAARVTLLGRAPDPTFRYYDPLMAAILAGDVARRREVTPQYVRSGIERYDTAIRYATDALGAFLDELDAAGRLDDALVVVTADHGDEFFEHGGFSHGYTLHEEVVRVPLLVKLPGQRAAREVDARVSLQDVYPTIAEAVGAELRQPVDGRSLVPWTLGQGDPHPRDLFLSAEFSPRLVARGVLSGTQKLVATEERYDGARGAVELYDLASDPGETRDLAAAQPERARELVKQLEQGASVPAAPAEDAVEGLDAERLRALGYAR